MAYIIYIVSLLLMWEIVELRQLHQVVQQLEALIAYSRDGHLKKNRNSNLYMYICIFENF